MEKKKQQLLFYLILLSSLNISTSLTLLNILVMLGAELTSSYFQTELTTTQLVFLFKS